MVVAVTGASGFLGEKLTSALLARGDRVIAVMRKSSENRHASSERLELRQANVDDFGSLVKAFEGADCVIHTVGLISYNPAKAGELWRVNVEGTKNAAGAARAAGVKKFLFTSSTAAIGVNEDSTVELNEDTPFNAGKLGMAYFDTKYQAETEVWREADQGLNAIIVNPGSLVGPGDRRRYEKCYPGLIYKYNPKFLVHGGINFVDINDVVKGHLLALEKGRSGHRYILGGENLLFADFIRRTNAILGRPSPKFIVPKSAMGGVSILLGLLNKLGVDLHFTPELVKNVCSWYLFVSSKKAQAELGYQPSRIDRSISGTIEWLKEIGRL